MSRDAKNPVHVLLVGTGVVGGAFVDLVTARAADLSPDVVLHALANRSGVFRGRSVIGAPIDDASLDDLAGRSCPVLVDATAAEDIDELWERALVRGIDVVSANKKPLAGKADVRDRIFAAAADGRADVRYEATVGAGLPVIRTLKDLVRTGDRVRRIDCVLSGTLGFLCDELHKKTPFARAVATAKERGYTEPDPREDLRGTDVARKAVILARELGAKIALEDVDVAPFTEDLEARVPRLEARGERLVYLARIEVKHDGVTISAGPTAVAASHPAASLRGGTSLVSFTTDRYEAQPLVVHGPGAGGVVTAAAVLADVLDARARDVSDRRQWHVACGDQPSTRKGRTSCNAAFVSDASSGSSFESTRAGS
jgi:bifunctional aspartokinase / homoserine dehydrogenase 1